MLKSNLKVLLAERNISITQVSNDTGISRTTLTSLMSVAKGIQFETMNALCNYLKITPSDLFIYVPYDIEIKLDSFKYKYGSSNNFFSFFIEVLKENRKYVILFNGYIYNFEKDFDIQLDLYQELETEEDKDDFKNIKYYLEKLPIQFFVDIENQIRKIFVEELEFSDFYDKINEEIPFIDDKIKEEDLYIKFDWSFLDK
ncbi:helix-turn-helix domain-containing protein [Fusobacterium perfoetens]|uniref:helix-turn-helix domain-containing protein n=1 Tax=Fusobacterium perfoetens TaxID=852 RepID=UPI001F355F2F|nr:helix-turn-helix transcriptional regulator [Fusobacterium perfoetens]MCF2612444.1 helix-turn-helix transcriptional regulator [Fusobacterium perfoetens]